MLHFLEDAVAVLSRLVLKLAGLACLGAFALVCWAVAMRYLANRPLVWADEAAGFLIVATVMLALPEAQRRGEHIGVDLLVHRASVRGRRLLLAFGALTVAVVALALILEGIEMVAFSHLVGLVSNTMPGVQLWTVQVLVPLGAALLLPIALLQAALWLRGREPRDYDDGGAAPRRGLE